MSSPSDSAVESHAFAILRFYEPLAAKAGARGLPQTIRDDGAVTCDGARHLVSSTRYAVNFARAHARRGGARYREFARAAWEFVEKTHLHADGSMTWIAYPDKADDKSQKAYGAAFLTLASAWAFRAGVAAADRVALALRGLDRFEDTTGLLADDLDAEGKFSAYRGQNCNMHAVEALLAVWHATGDRRSLDRAARTARRFCLELAATAGGWIWEHYDADWRPDFDFHKDNPRDLYRPWGFQVGHQTEWAKLLCQLSLTPASEAWMRPAARELLVSACRAGWDTGHGGLFYGLKQDRSLFDDEKHFWVQAESFAAARLVAKLTGCSESAEWATRLWTYAQDKFVIRELGGVWRRVLTRDHRATDGTLAVPGGKADYHTFGACLDTLV